MKAFAQAISVLPTSLESLDIEVDQKGAKPAQDALSSFICRCGSSLRSFSSRGPLSDAATLHLMQLPNLSRWRTDHGPPQVTSTPVLQSLEDFRFDGEGALPWLQFLASDGRDTRERLKFLDLPGDSVIDSVFLSSAVNLRNLIKLQDLATSLPRLECLYLGYPCGLNTCKTTVASLMSISIHCPDLSELEIHFNVKTIVDDMQGLIDEDVVHNKAKCQLRSIYVGGMRLQLDSAGLRTVATGFGVIFPHMENLEGYHPQWPAPSYEIEMRWTGGYAVEAEPDP